MTALALPFTPQEDPVFPLPSREKVEGLLRAGPEGVAALQAFFEQREANIKLREADRLKFSIEKWRPKIWDLVDDLLCDGKKVILVDPDGGAPKEILGGCEVLVLGGNRCSKTEWIAYRCMRTLIEKRGARTWSFHTSEPTSVAIQQPRFWTYMPPEYRTLKSSQVGNVKYTQKNGFSENTFVLPNTSQHWFKNYKQDPDTIEGEELDGAATDELVPIEVVETLRYRLATRHGWLGIIFTPIEGWSPTVRGLAEGARTVFSLPAHRLPLTDKEGKPAGCERVPRVQQAVNPDLKIVYFHTEDNPFSDPDEIYRKASKKGRDEILCRVYGVPTKEMKAKFVRFSEDVHVIDDANVPALGSDYLYSDPCPGRNWFHLWVRATPWGDLVVWREWPCPGIYIPGVGDPGDWAVPDGKMHDGKRGPAQVSFGFGLERIRDEILRMEGCTWNEQARQAVASDSPAALELLPGKVATIVRDRKMDSRAAAAPTLARNAVTTLLDEMASAGLDFEPASGEHQQEGVEMITDALDFEIDPADPKRERFLRKPKLYIVRSCKNLIYAMKTWTGADGKDGATKDPIDVLRYLVLDKPIYMDPVMMRGRAPRGAY